MSRHRRAVDYAAYGFTSSTSFAHTVDTRPAAPTRGGGFFVLEQFIAGGRQGRPRVADRWGRAAHENDGRLCAGGDVPAQIRFHLTERPFRLWREPRENPRKSAKNS